MKSASEKLRFSGIQRILCALIAVFMVATVFAASVADYEAAEEIVVLDEEITEENIVIEEEVSEETNVNVELENEEEPNVIEEPVNEEEVEPNVIEEPEEEEEEPEVPNPQPQAGPIKLVIGTDSDQNSGQGHGYARRSRTSYYSYDGYYMYNYVSGTNYENRGWAVYDLSDLKQYQGITITSGEIWWRHDYRRAVGQLDFWTMESIPRDRVSGSTAKGWFEEIGGPSSVKLGTNMFSGTTNSNNFDVTLSISADGITWLNSKLSSGTYDVSMGADIYSLLSGTYGYVYCYDVRLVLYATYTSAASTTGNVAVGDELSGYAYTSGSLYDIGRIYTSSSGRGFAVWDPNVVMGMIPSDGQEVDVTKVSVRLNSPYGYLAGLGIYHMSRDPRIASGSQIATDARDGTRYLEIPTGSYTSLPAEHEWDLGVSGLTDFVATLDGSPNFFALGFSRTSNYNYMYSPKLVIEYEIVGAQVGGPTAEAGPDMTSNEGDTVTLDGSGSTGNTSQIVTYEWDFESDGVYDYAEGVLPPTDKTIRLGPDNPEHDGHAQGYTRRSGSSYYMYTYYWSYAYWRSTYEYRGWAVFDLEDLTEWSGANVKDAKLVIHNYYRYYADVIGFTALDTTPWTGASTAQRKNIYDESGPSGTQIGSYDPVGNYDTSRHTFVVDLNSNGVNKIKSILSGSSPRTFGVGIYVDDVVPGYSYGYVRWTDVRLEVTFAAVDLEKTQSGDGVAFGDDWAGRVYRSSSGYTYNYPYGYTYLRTYTSYSYRGYSQWDVSSIVDALPNNVEIKKVGVRLNHRYSSLSNIYVYDMTYDVKTASPANIFNDAGTGTQYAGPLSTLSGYREYEWDLGTDAVNNLQNAIDSGTANFGLGFMTTSTSGYAYQYGHKLVIEWDSSGGGGAIVDGKVDHAFGDNGVYTVTLRVTDANGLKDTDTCDVTVSNVVPTITAFGPFTVDEGVPLNVATDATDVGSDDLEFVWEFELSYSYTNMHYNGIGPDPLPSPYGTFPFTVMDAITHTHGDNGVYDVKLTVTDDDGGSATYTTTLTVLNVAPTVVPFGPFTLNEGSPLTIDAITTDLGSDDLTFLWEFELGPTITTTYYNDGTGPDPAQSPMGLYPFYVTDTVTHTYGDNAVYDLTLTVTDDDGGTYVRTTTITVNNVAPMVSLYAYVELEFTLRVSGEKWHNVELYVMENGHGVGYANVLRMPGDPDDQAVTITGVKCDVTKVVTTLVLYTPFDDAINGQINGADPAWVTLKFLNEEEHTYDNTFNYNKPEEWAWTTPISQFFVGNVLSFESTATDVGSDDLRYTWDWGDGSPYEGDMFYNDGTGPDPVKSPDGNFPFTVGEYRTHVYWTPVNHVLTLTVQDDDGGITQVIVTIILT